MTHHAQPAPPSAASPPGAPAPPQPTRRRSPVGRIPFYFLVPALLLYSFVLLVPSGQGAVLAFTDWDGLSRGWSFVGLANFRDLLDDGAARGAVLHTVTIAVVVTIVQNTVGLLLALGVDSLIKSRNVLRILFFAPAVMTPVVTSYLWRYLYAPDGAINSTLEAAGLGALAQDWLGDSDLAIWSVIAMVIWQFSGYSMVIFLAGLQGVPKELREAAAVDGAGPARRFWYVIRPMLLPALTINLMLSMINSLKMFDQVWVLTGGGPGQATETMSTLIYRNAFQFGEYAYSTAVALVLTALVAVISAVQYREMARQERGAR
ncbi:raffinose/stachyose/melibiose transport system permease protein [Lipingzhangella halophila]|uniref:Raffinose/stachyose/melibiose transport system permease protein n=1 Tax=Lipingzhangella halophila TaxID=1783352 RepID=A0A7W7W543_9ACTN|nr:sugar ABC transporter permease [Lipingzhangella halophila]MBB4934857.1 raffinose/stachyose/melibiose transport system permease protein [Lipingzhangella halophila]